MVTYYYSDGQKELEGYHILNRRAGMWRGWHEDGSQSFRSEYRDGELYRWKISARRHGSNLQPRENRFGR